MLDIARCYPFSLGIGDVMTNLDRLAITGAGLHDKCTLPIKWLLAFGFSRHRLVQCIQLITQLSWSAQLTEQGHGSAAAVHHLHPAHAAPKLALKSFLHMCRALAAKSASTLAMHRRQRKRQRLQAKSPHVISGRNVFVNDLSAYMKSIPALTMNSQ